MYKCFAIWVMILTIKHNSGENSSCHRASNGSLLNNINYPALVIPIEPHKRFHVKIHRTVTNVGSHNSSYRTTVIKVPKINISVEQKILPFRLLNEKRSFVVIFIGGTKSNQTVFSLSLVRLDGTTMSKVQSLCKDS